MPSIPSPQFQSFLHFPHVQQQHTWIFMQTFFWQIYVFFLITPAIPGKKNLCTSTFTFQLGFVSFVCFPRLSLLLRPRRSATEEPETKIPAPTSIDNYLHNFYYYTVKSCQNLGACLIGFLLASFFFFLNATWPLVTKRACTGSWIVKTPSLLPLFAQQLLSACRTEE